MRNEKTSYPPPQWGKLFCKVSRIKITKTDAGFALTEKKQSHPNHQKNSLKDRAAATLSRGLLLSVVLIFSLISQFLSYKDRLGSCIRHPIPQLRNKF